MTETKITVWEIVHPVSHWGLFKFDIAPFISQHSTLLKIEPIGYMGYGVGDA